MITRLAGMQLSGAMFHDKLSKAFAFLGLEGFEMLHLERSIDELHGYHISCQLCLKQLDAMPIVDAETADIVPSSWSNGKRQDMRESSRQQYVKDLMSRWVNWEETTVASLTEMHDDGCPKQGILTHLRIVICDVESELAEAKRLQLELAACGYDMAEAVSMQHCLKQKFRKALRHIDFGEIA